MINSRITQPFWPSINIPITSCARAASTPWTRYSHHDRPSSFISQPQFRPNSSFTFISKRYSTSTRRRTESSTSAARWIDRLPERIRWTRPYLELARLDKPIGTWLLYWPCAWSITMTACYGAIPPSQLIYNLALFGTGAVVMRGAGCTINDMWDSRIDRKVERTRSRPLASRAVTPLGAWTLLGLQLSAGLAVLTQLNWYSIFLGASSLAVVVVYPLMKRITYWPQVVLGLAFNWGALLGSSALLGYCDWVVAVPLYLAGISWTLVYDTIYAHQDKRDDLMTDVKSTALLFGESSPQILSFFSLTFLSSLSFAGYMAGLGLPFYAISVGGAAAHLRWQLKNVDWDEAKSCWKMFGSNRDLGFLVWLGLMAEYGSKMILG